MKQFFCAVSAVDTNKQRLRWHLHHSPSSSPLSVSLRCIKGLWCYLCRGMPKECAVLTTTLYVRMETELSVVRGWCWFSLCKCIQVNLIWCTMLRPDTPGSWLFSWLIALLRGRDHVRGNCKRALSHSVQQDQTCLIAELTRGFAKITWTCPIFVECCHNSHFDGLIPSS